MGKYLALFKISWQEGLVYRLNFVLWRVRSVLALLLVYFIWWTVFQSTDQVFGYTQSSILTYILIATLIRAIVLSSQVMNLSNHINDGSISILLTRPMGIIQSYISTDLSDKLLNILFVICEISLIIFLLKPHIILQIHQITLILFLIATSLGIILYFCISFIIAILAFWVENSWGPMFLLMIFLEGLGGGLFPIDILPKTFFNFLMLTPFPYLIYFPAKLYLGTLSTTEMTAGFTVLIFWVITLWIVMNYLLNKGLKYYSAVGN